MTIRTSFSVRGCGVRDIALPVMLAGCLLGGASPSFGGDEASAPFVALEYRVVTTNAQVGDGERKTPLVPRVEGTLRATLGPRRVEVEEGGRRIVVDYERERVLSIDAQGRARESSLLATFAFVDMEMRNRTKIHAALKAGGAKELTESPREVSILFGVLAEGDATQVTTAADGAATVFSDRDEELARWTPSAETLDDAQRASLSRFLQRRCALHPSAREMIVADGHAPAAFRFRRHDAGVRSTTELTLVAAHRTAAPALPGGARFFDDEDPVARVAKRVLDPSKEDVAARLGRDDFLRLSREARTAGRYEDAGLLLVECSLQTAADVSDALRELRSDEASRARVDSALGAISIRDPAKELDALGRLDRSVFSRPQVIDVFRANCLASTSRPGEARRVMLGALERSPWLAGGWKDLGDMCYALFETEHAWSAWKAGRRANPDHPMWKQVRDFENVLRKRFRAFL
jgi:hypothetical protein